MAHARHDAPEYQIPESRGIPSVVVWFFFIGVAIIVYMGVISAIGAGTFHVWPASKSAQIDLRSK